MTKDSFKSLRDHLDKIYFKYVESKPERSEDDFDDDKIIQERNDLSQDQLNLKIIKKSKYPQIARDYFELIKNSNILGYYIDYTTILNFAVAYSKFKAKHSKLDEIKSIDEWLEARKESAIKENKWGEINALSSDMHMIINMPDKYGFPGRYIYNHFLEIPNFPIRFLRELNCQDLDSPCKLLENWAKEDNMTDISRRFSHTIIRELYPIIYRLKLTGAVNCPFCKRTDELLLCALSFRYSDAIIGCYNCLVKEVLTCGFYSSESDMYYLKCYMCNYSETSSFTPRKFYRADTEEFRIICDSCKNPNLNDNDDNDNYYNNENDFNNDDNDNDSGIDDDDIEIGGEFVEIAI